MWWKTKKKLHSPVDSLFWEFCCCRRKFYNSLKNNYVLKIFLKKIKMYFFNLPASILFNHHTCIQLFQQPHIKYTHKTLQKLYYSHHYHTVTLIFQISTQTVKFKNKKSNKICWGICGSTSSSIVIPTNIWLVIL